MMPTTSSRFLSDDLTTQQLKCELQSSGVDTFVVSDNKENIHRDIHKVIRLISKTPYHERRRVCLLYKDSKSRLFNVVLTGAEGLSAKWERVESMYVGMQAVFAMALLARLVCYYIDFMTSK